MADAGTDKAVAAGHRLEGTSPREARGGIGGAAGEAGAEYRASVTAWVVAHALRGLSLPGIDLPEETSVPESVLLEGDAPVDDIEVKFSTGGRCLIQAKRRLGFGRSQDGGMASVVDQWKRALLAGGLNPETDRLVAAVGRPTDEIRRLGEVLKVLRSEVRAQLTRSRQALIGKLLATATDLPPQLQDQMLHMAVVLPLNVDEAGLVDAEKGELLLDGTVVRHGEGRQAWTHLMHSARSLARRREGRTIEGWMAILREGRLTLVADAEGAAAARLEARRLAVERYRESLVELGSRLDLRSLGAEIPPLPVSQAWMTLEVAPVQEQGEAQGGRGNKQLDPEWFGAPGRSGRKGDLCQASWCR
jgi:hypothetical protein